ncbi:MAG: hypothetical protein EOQ64_24235 [Mesorhizobium sp.]|uniref:phage tail fiber protein n=1 Tax=Mesorhizobium sp. TaxID=1871066 RepID=UPI000FE65C95|nr:hypothetical protein [Mesorhizobium sp.]RWG53337.1 MAG: hypothetical protein EOQ64_24235 [Mesorhizobium sp.]RWH42960.1 MAG: hypothetical protein EOQ78_15000 [Mesorhizobium sp.]RWI26174.1 MAG: hypothetical protein EOQ94_11485 [Mesorhizobium sp.]
MSTLTAANAVITLAVPNLFPTPVQLQGFATDNIYDMDSVDQVETAMGVDGILSGGFVYNPINQTFVLQADSPSIAFFETWASTQVQAKDVYTANGSTTLPSLGRSYISTKGFLVSLPPMPAAAKILQPRRFAIRWQSVQSVPN